MDGRGQSHVPAALKSLQYPTGGLVGPGAGLNILEKK